MHRPRLQKTIADILLFARAGMPEGTLSKDAAAVARQHGAAPERIRPARERLRLSMARFAERLGPPLAWGLLLLSACGRSGLNPDTFRIGGSGGSAGGGAGQGGAGEGGAPTVTEFPLPSLNSPPTGIAVGPDGNIWFTEPIENKICRITPGGVVSEYE